jgi:hypothetical protein
LATPDPNPDDDFASTNITVISNAQPPQPPQLTGNFVYTNGTFQFHITSQPGQTNVVYASTNLVNWVPIRTNVGPFTFTDPNAANYPYRFYRDSVTGP